MQIEKAFNSFANMAIMSFHQNDAGSCMRTT